MAKRTGGFLGRQNRLGHGSEPPLLGQMNAHVPPNYLDVHQRYRGLTHSHMAVQTRKPATPVHLCFIGICGGLVPETAETGNQCVLRRRLGALLPVEQILF